MYFRRNVIYEEMNLGLNFVSISMAHLDYANMMLIYFRAVNLDKPSNKEM